MAEYLIIKANDETEELSGDITLEVAQKAVGGYVKVLPLYSDKNRIMIVNEDGLPLALPNNKAATALVGFPIVGNVLVCNRHDFS